MLYIQFIISMILPISHKICIQIRLNNLLFNSLSKYQIYFVYEKKLNVHICRVKADFVEFVSNIIFLVNIAYNMYFIFKMYLRYLSKNIKSHNWVNLTLIQENYTILFIPRKCSIHGNTWCGQWWVEGTTRKKNRRLKE